MLKENNSLTKHLWLGVIKREYERGRILEESNLHLTVYFHLRRVSEISKSKTTKPFIYPEMPFSTRMKNEGKKNPLVDLALVNLEEDNVTPTDLVAVVGVQNGFREGKKIALSIERNQRIR